MDTAESVEVGENPPEDVTADTGAEDTQAPVEEAIPPAEDAAGSETVSQSTGAAVSVPTPAKTHSLLWLWIVLGVLVLLVAGTALYLFVLKKDKGRH